MNRHISDALLTLMAMLSFAFVVAVSFQSKISIEPASIQIAAKSAG